MKKKSCYSDLPGSLCIFSVLVTWLLVMKKLNIWNNSELTKHDEVIWEWILLSNGSKRSVNGHLKPVADTNKCFYLKKKKQQRNEMIAHLKDQLQEMKAKTSMEGKYIKKDAEVKFSNL